MLHNFKKKNRKIFTRFFILANSSEIVYNPPMSPESKVCSIHTSCSDLRTKYTSEAQVQTSLEHCANLEEYDKILLEMTALPKDDATFYDDEVEDREDLEEESYSFTDEITENITEDLPTESARQVASMRFVTLQVFQIK